MVTVRELFPAVTARPALEVAQLTLLPGLHPRDAIEVRAGITPKPFRFFRSQGLSPLGKSPDPDYPIIEPADGEHMAVGGEVFGMGLEITPQCRVRAGWGCDLV